MGETAINLGREHFIKGDLERAEPLFARGKAIYEKAFGPDHPGVAAAINNLGDIALESGRYDEAVPHYEARARDLARDLRAPAPHTAAALGHWGVARLRQGRPEAARVVLEKAVAAFATGDGGGEQEATARFDLAKAIVATKGDRAAAVADAEQARATLAKAGGGQMLSVADIDAWLAEQDT